MQKLLVPQLQEASSVRYVWHAAPPLGTKLEDILNPEYWGHVTKRLAPRARIEVTPEGNEWFAELFVTSVTPNVGATVKLLRHHNLVGDVKAPETKAEAVTSEDPYYIKFRGPTNRWCVLRTTDHSVVKDGLTKDEAATEAENLKLAA